MDKDYSNMVSQLLIIGNGFDLKCGLQSKFTDYYNNSTDMTEVLDKMNELFNDRNMDLG